jgi:predicted DNA-binding transcriptional regulator AlpA
MQFIRPRQVLEMIGVSRTTLWRMVREGSFPNPVQITARDNGARGYLLDAVETWMRERTGAGLVTGEVISRVDRISKGAQRGPVALERAARQTVD